MTNLVGQIVENVFISKDRTNIGFETCPEFSTLFYQTENDCCNYVWFYHLSGLENLLGAVVNSVELRMWRGVSEEHLSDAVSDSDDVEDACFWKIATNKGYCDIEVRNTHNGYYSGRIINLGRFFDKGRVTEEEMLKDMTLVKEDF